MGKSDKTPYERHSSYALQLLQLNKSCIITMVLTEPIRFLRTSDYDFWLFLVTTRVLVWMGRIWICSSTCLSAI